MIFIFFGQGANSLRCEPRMMEQTPFHVICRIRGSCQSRSRPWPAPHARAPLSHLYLSCEASRSRRARCQLNPRAHSPTSSPQSRVLSQCDLRVPTVALRWSGSGVEFPHLNILCTGRESKLVKPPESSAPKTQAVVHTYNYHYVYAIVCVSVCVCVCVCC
jgi:hypothetical protein